MNVLNDDLLFYYIIIAICSIIIILNIYNKWRMKQELKWYLKMRMLDNNVLYENLENRRHLNEL